MFFLNLPPNGGKGSSYLISNLVLVMGYLLISSCGTGPSTQFQDLGVGISPQPSFTAPDDSRSDELLEENELDATREEPIDPDEQVSAGFEPSGDPTIDRVIVVAKTKAEDTELPAEASDPTDGSELVAIDLDDPDPVTLGEGTIGTSTADDGQTVYSQVLVMLQPEETKVDILWVIDSSLSMAEEQSYLGENFSSFMTGLAASNQEFQTAVTTTDVCRGIDYFDTSLDPESLPPMSERACPFIFGGDPSTHLRGSFVGEEGRKVLTANDADLIDKFSEYTNVGTNGSNFEHGIKATSLAVKKIISGENENLIRSDAHLSVIIVTDEEDDGIGLSQYDPALGVNPTSEGWTTFKYTNDELIAYLDSVKGQGKFSISTITGTRDEDGELCRSIHSAPTEEGTALIAAAKKTGGTVQSICDSNWADSLSQMGQDLNAQISQINLLKTPIEDSIKVYVNDEIYDSWSFVDGNNSLKFYSDAIPSPGSSIVVTYDSLEP